MRMGVAKGENVDEMKCPKVPELAQAGLIRLSTWCDRPFRCQNFHVCPG
jgi:hypothetical protein